MNAPPTTSTSGLVGQLAVWHDAEATDQSKADHEYHLLYIVESAGGKEYIWREDVTKNQGNVAGGYPVLDANGKVASAQLPSLDYIPNSEKGVSVATLGSNGKVPASQLPSLDVLDEIETLKDQTQAIYDSVMAAVSEYYVGPAYNYGVTVNGTVLSFTWTDPADNNVVKWARTRLVMKQGGFPANETDGTILVDETVRNTYKTDAFTWNAGVTSDYYFALFTQSTGGAWHTGDDCPRFTTDTLTWATIAMMARAGTLLQYPGMAIGSVVDIPTLATFPKMRWKLAHIDYKGNYATVNDYMYDNTRSHNAIFISNYLPCWGADNNSAWMTEFDQAETLYGANWDTYFLAGRSYWKVVDSEYVQLTAGTDYENGASCAEWETEHGTALYVKNHAGRNSYGYNSWKESTLRQRMNAVGTGWWTKQNPFDSGLGLGTQGLATDADSWFTDLIMPVYNRTARNTIGTASWGGGGGYDITLDKIWLPSIKEVFGNNNNNIAEGAQFDYFLNVATTAAQRIQRDEGGTARNVWLRSPNTGNVNHEYAINTSGASLMPSADYSCALLPAMCIA